MGQHLLQRSGDGRRGGVLRQILHKENLVWFAVIVVFLHWLAILGVLFAGTGTVIAIITTCNEVISGSIIANDQIV